MEHEIVILQDIDFNCIIYFDLKKKHLYMYTHVYTYIFWIAIFHMLMKTKST
jgi:hypothetical protein